MEEVLAKEVEDVLLLKDGDPPLRQHQALIIKNRQELAQILRDLPALPFQKRVKHVDENGTSLVILTDSEAKEKNYAYEQTTIVAPAVAPLLQEQFINWSDKYWPVLKVLNAPTLETQFNDDEKIELTKYMSLLWEEVKLKKAKMGALFIDPRQNNKIMSFVTLQHIETPISHAIMLAIEEIGKQLRNARNLSHQKILTNGEAYLCTGFDVFLTHEPCAMCAMALLHSRVKRVFYDIEDKQVGALGSVRRLHTLPNINHRYRVFRKFFELPTVNNEEKLIDFGGCFA